jgi:hypothetical protein
MHHPSAKHPCSEARHKRRHNSQYRVSLDALSRVIQEFVGNIAATLCDTPCYTQAFLYSIGNRAGSQDGSRELTRQRVQPLFQLGFVTWHPPLGLRASVNMFCICSKPGLWRYGPSNARASPRFALGKRTQRHHGIAGRPTR